MKITQCELRNDLHNLLILSIILLSINSGLSIKTIIHYILKLNSRKSEMRKDGSFKFLYYIWRQNAHKSTDIASHISLALGSLLLKNVLYSAFTAELCIIVFHACVFANWSRHSVCVILSYVQVKHILALYFNQNFKLTTWIYSVNDLVNS